MDSCCDVFYCIGAFICGIICSPCLLIGCCCCGCGEGLKDKYQKLYCTNCSIMKFIIYLIYLVIIFILSIIFIFPYKKYDDDSNEIAYEIEKTLNSKLIYSFKNKTICELDEEELVLGAWDRTKVGCYCAGSIYNYECSEELIKQDCKTIPSHKKINYTMINSNYICIKKSTLTYRDLLKSGQIIEKKIIVLIIINLVE